jgi:hypothetical protein
MINRRGLITGLASFVAAPAIVRYGSLMPVKNLAIAEEIAETFVTRLGVIEWCELRALAAKDIDWIESLRFNRIEMVAGDIERTNKDGDAIRIRF